MGTEAIAADWTDAQRSEEATSPASLADANEEQTDVSAVVAMTRSQADVARAEMNAYRAEFGIGPLPEAMGDDPTLQPIPTRLPSGNVAALVGKAVLQQVALSGTEFAFNEIVTALGLGADARIEETLETLQLSLAELERKMLDGIKDILDANAESNFLMAQNEVGIRSGEISAYLLDYLTWEDLGFTPDEQYVRNMSSLVYTALGQLNGALLAEEAGAVPLLLQAASVQQHTTDLQLFWDRLDYYRDVYAAVFAEALLLLNEIQAFDPSGSVSQRLHAAENLSLQTIRDLNGRFGVPILQASAGKPQYLHVQGEDWVFTDVRRPWFPRESWDRVDNRVDYERYLHRIRDGFHAGSHGVADLEAYFDASNLRKRYDLLDTYRHETFPQGKRVVSQARHDVIEIVGDEISIRTVSDGPEHDHWVHSDAETRAWMESFSAWSARKNGPPQGQTMQVEQNSGGRAAWFEDDWIESAMFGVKDIEIDRLDELGAVQLTIGDPFADYSRLRLVDPSDGTSFASVGEHQSFVTVEIPSNGSADRLIAIQQGDQASGAFYPRAESAVVLDGTRDWIIRINDAPSSLDIRTEGDGKVTAHDGSGNLLCADVTLCSTDLPWTEDVIVTPVDGDLGVFSHWVGTCDEVEGQPDACLFTHTPHDGTVTAVFETPENDITFEFDWDFFPEGSISANGKQVCQAPNTCSRTYPAKGGPVSITAAATTKWNTFSHWSGACNGTNPTCTVHPNETSLRVKAHYRNAGLG